MAKNVLIIGKRRPCYKAALKLGHKTFLWSDSDLHISRKKKLSGWIEHPFDACETEIPSDIMEKISAWNIDFVIAATESSVNIASRFLRSHFNLPGTPLEITNLLHDKYEMKKTALRHHIPITDFQLIENQSAAELIQDFGLPLVVKPLAESGARGVRVLKTLEEVQQYATQGLLAEAFVEGSEVSVETFVKDGVAIFHNITDYLHQWQKSILPAELDKVLAQKILEINDNVLSAFEVQNGMTHAEFYLTKKGPIFGEMAIRPPGGYYMELIEKAYQFNPWEIYVRLETDEEVKNLPNQALTQAAVYILHPGAGHVQKISGKERTEGLSQVFSFKLRVQEGDTIQQWESTSSECGHILLSATSRQVLLDSISEIENTLKIQLAPSLQNE